MDTLEGRMDVYDFARQHFGVPHSLEDDVRAVRALTLDGVRTAMGQLLEHLTENVGVTHLTGEREAIGNIDHIVQRTDIA